MALADDVQAQVETAYLAELTNPNDRSLKTVDTTRLGYAVTAVEAAFKRHVQAAYDSADDQHVDIGIQGVLIKLRQRTRSGDSGGAATQEWKDWIDECTALRDASSRGRVMAQTNSEVVPTSEQRGSETPRPWFDGRRFDDLAPNAPAASSDDDD